MREILFRGKMTDNGEWVFGYLARGYFDRTDYCIAEYKGENRYCGALIPVIPETVGQFTGLTDKNGTKIFEGDVVEILPKVEEIGVITWQKEIARFVIEADGITGDFDNYYGSDLEVIGNIHDNPELMGGISDG